MLLTMSTSPPQEDPPSSKLPPVSSNPSAPASGPQPGLDVCVDGRHDGGPTQPGVPLRTVLVERQRRVGRPIALFLITCLTTFCTGCYQWTPAWIFFPKPPEFGGETFSVLVQRNWLDGLLFMICVMAVLMFHEMGHFLMTLRHRVHASYPHFIPFPLMVTGTMGAVIAMDGPRMDRKSLFDIGIAGPLAGLILIVPFVVIGIMIAEPGPASLFANPLLVESILIPLLRPDLSAGQHLALNPIYMAGWVGMLVTGLNMIPISQLDGGHVSYSVFGSYAKWVARGIIMVAIAWIVWTNNYNWVMMLFVVLLIGVDHPPTSNDSLDIGWGRRILGVASFAIPILCFTPIPLAF